jgi:hypothetical protein
MSNREIPLLSMSFCLFRYAGAGPGALVAKEEFRLSLLMQHPYGLGLLALQAFPSL